jgi:hypothetical protein
MYGLVHVRPGTMKKAEGISNCLIALLRVMSIKRETKRRADIKAEWNIVLPSCDDRTSSARNRGHNSYPSFQCDTNHLNLFVLFSQILPTFGENGAEVSSLLCAR